MGSQSGDATVVRFRSREDKKPKHADELAWPKQKMQVRSSPALILKGMANSRSLSVCIPEQSVRSPQVINPQHESQPLFNLTCKQKHYQTPGSSSPVLTDKKVQPPDEQPG